MLKVDNISLYYGAAQALRGVSLSAEPGKVTCVLGRNGVGKTSLLRAMVGQYPISGGSIALEYVDMERKPGSSPDLSKCGPMFGQMVEFIDYAVGKYGHRVKFLNFHEAIERVNGHLLAGNPLRSATGHDNGVRLVDLNNDGKIDLAVFQPGDPNTSATGAVSVLLGEGDGSFQSPKITTLTVAIDFAVADFNVDHKADVAVADQVHSRVE